MSLYKRTYRCTTCGLVVDRDENSAVNIWDRYDIGLAAIIQWYFARLGPHASMEKCGVLHNGNDEVGIAVMPHFSVVQQLKLW
jgi:hypothetical protein